MTATEKESIYEDPRWKEKSKSIMQRDNYTCQRCGVFNPSIGNHMVEEDNYIELHQYNKYDSSYTLTIKSPTNNPSSPFISRTIRFDFINAKLVMPTLNVHHQYYIRNHELWEYDNECFITLCEKCHRDLHSKEQIPEYITKKGLSFLKLFSPSPLSFNKKDIQSFTPWKFVTKINDEYEYVSHIQAKITWVHIDNFDHKHLENDQQIIKNMYSEFVKKYLSDYK